MKKITFLLMAFVFAMSVSAQENTSTSADEEFTPVHSHGMWFGGGIGFNDFADQGFKYTIAPGLGIMVGENIGVGADLSFSGGNDQSAWAVSPYFRYYLHITENFAFFGDAFAGYGKVDPDTTADNDDSSIMTFGARPGIQYWFTSRWSLAASTNVLQFTSRKDAAGNSVSSNGFGLDFSKVNFSFFFHF